MISVIIPIFNTAKYLNQCVDSVLGQTYTDLEVILVDDGSTDESAGICDKYSELDSRVKVIHQANGGLSAARNAGLDRATGDYISFVDSDDWIYEKCLEILLDEIEKSNKDFVFCDIESEKLGEMMGCDWLVNPISREYVLMVVVWNKLYKKSVFDDIRFEPGVFHEDEFLANEILDKGFSYEFVDEKLYYYRDNETGITGKANAFDPRHLDAIDAYSKRIEQSVARGDMEFARVTARNGLYKLLQMYRENPASQIRDKYKLFYKKYGKCLSIKQRLKYKLLMR